ncbi:PREDICTED: eukaryotic translation initiation factor 5B partial [Prunus dulcis]|uniref:PREDICTED: eukaryotic translation initiation factor 5B partial n=1 Tax=Prunus dulcis TaxID=3755 RepID=A0A5E4FQ66_PRUDU|nr:PREDICTED: eukaryotic translation initiation factor 5B partial [Prunus dulcis]
MECDDLIYRFKRFNPSHKLNKNFMGKMLSLSKDLTEEMIEEYEGEDASQKVIDGDAVPEKTEGALPDPVAAEDVVPALIEKTVERMI